MPSAGRAIVAAVARLPSLIGARSTASPLDMLTRGAASALAVLTGDNAAGFLFMGAVTFFFGAAFLWPGKKTPD